MINFAFTDQRLGARIELSGDERIRDLLHAHDDIHGPHCSRPGRPAPLSPPRTTALDSRPAVVRRRCGRSNSQCYGPLVVTTVDEVRSVVPARAELMRLARVTAAGLASRMEFNYDEIEDIRLAIDESCFGLTGAGAGRQEWM